MFFLLSSIIFFHIVLLFDYFINIPTTNFLIGLKLQGLSFTLINDLSFVFSVLKIPFFEMDCLILEDWMFTFKNKPETPSYFFCMNCMVY